LSLPHEEAHARNYPMSPRPRFTVFFLNLMFTR